MDSIFDHIENLIGNVDFIQIPPTDKTGVLLQGLKDKGFVSSDTKIEHFRVLFGIPIPSNSVPFERIKWRKNKQLLRWFIVSLFPERERKEAALTRLCYILFADIHGEKVWLPQVDWKRLEQSADFENLNNLLKEFNR